jgi:hypothetical protein
VQRGAPGLAEAGALRLDAGPQQLDLVPEPPGRRGLPVWPVADLLLAH